MGGRFLPSRVEIRISSMVGIEVSQNLVAFLIAMVGVGAWSIVRWEYGSGCHLWGSIVAAAMVR